ncbi:MAG: zinc transporter ZupT [Agathobacter sp.]|nr:zinc transporter ZupT [Agathobacter sp.]
MGNIMFAFMLTLFAGLSTGVGSLIAFFAKKTNKKFLSISLGFSAGVMIYVSMIEIFVKAQDALSSELGEKLGTVWTVVAFFGGMFLIALIDKVIPSGENPHEPRNVIADCEGCGDCEICVKEQKAKREKEQLMRTGVFTALAIAIHNFPEGMATFVSAFQDPSIAIPIVAAIAIHNIPEGIAVSVPIYQATGSKRRAFIYSFLSGFAEPVGALIGWLVLIPIMSDMVYGIIFAGVAGIMVFISIDELLPAAREYGEHHLSVYGMIAGMMVMAASLLLFM